MKKQITLLFTILGLTLFVLSSCEKDDDPVVKTKTELITSGSWRFGAATFGGAPVPPGALQPCQTDNIMTFAIALTGVLDEGLTKCNGTDPQTKTFTWNFASSETILNISTVLFAGGSSQFTIVALNESQLVLSQFITPPGGTAQNAVVTFLH